MSNMKITVILAAYNGERYINEQLESIKNQTRPADEVLIVDDCSQDRTRELVESFIRQNNLKKSWHCCVNKENLGHIATFSQAAEMIKEGIIFFSDQDDIWKPKKIEMMARPFENPQALAVSCSFTCVNDKRNPCNSIHNILRMYKLRKYTIPSFSRQVKTLESPGLTLAVRVDFYHELIPFIRFGHLAHDTPVGLVAACRKGFVRVGRPLVERRIHSHNVSNPEYSISGKLSNFDRYLDGRKFQLRHLCALQDMLNTKVGKQLTQEIESRKKSIEGLQDLAPSMIFPQLFSFSPYCNHIVEIVNILAIVRQLAVLNSDSVDIQKRQ